MRIRGWYAYHFPELIRLVPDNHQYARVAQFIGDKDSLDKGKLPDLADLLDDDTTVTQNILEAARGSMGSGLSEIDMLNISLFATRVISLSDYRNLDESEQISCQYSPDSRCWEGAVQSVEDKG
jgi:nucleolar protein 56